jgi:hypothetical protein
LFLGFVFRLADDEAGAKPFEATTPLGEILVELT